MLIYLDPFYLLVEVISFLVLSSADRGLILFLIIVFYFVVEVVKLPHPITGSILSFLNGFRRVFIVL